MGRLSGECRERCYDSSRALGPFSYAGALSKSKSRTRTTIQTLRQVQQVRRSQPRPDTRSEPNPALVHLNFIKANPELVDRIDQLRRAFVTQQASAHRRYPGGRSALMSPRVGQPESNRHSSVSE